MNGYPVSKLTTKNICVSVPASKSILNRALLLAAFTDGDTRLICGEYGDDSEALLACLSELGIEVEQLSDGLLVHGKKNFSRSASLNVENAGTVARFLTSILAFFGGNYEFYGSSRMKERPMEILPLLSSLGVNIEYLEKPDHFPFRMHSDGINVGKVVVDTDVSTQYASGLMLAAALSGKPLSVELTGGRTSGSYIRMTAALIRAFGGDVGFSAEKILSITPILRSAEQFTVEPDVSGACYFYALSLLCNASVCVRGVHLNSLQGDMMFLKLLARKGVRLKETDLGVVADGTILPPYNGIDIEMTDFSDQTMTVAVLAAFAGSPSILRDVSHIRSQECDRVEAIIENLKALGANAFTNGDDIFIEPAPVCPCLITTFSDHRVAMAFALAGLKAGGITIDDPSCCSKTFPNFFKILEELTK